MKEQRTIYPARHGEIRSNIKSKRYIGQSDLPLSDTGVLQALRLREELRCASLSGVYCSDVVHKMTVDVINDSM